MLTIVLGAQTLQLEEWMLFFTIGHVELKKFLQKANKKPCALLADFNVFRASVLSYTHLGFHHLVS